MRTITALAAALVLAAGCGGDGDEADDQGADGGGAPSQGTFVAVDIDYEQAPGPLAAGEVTLELVNEGDLRHNVVIEELGGQAVVEANGGETATGTVTLETGTYTAYCSVAGHRASGMEATLTVED